MAPLFHIALFPLDDDIAEDEEDKEDSVVDDDEEDEDEGTGIETLFFLAMISLARFEVFFSFTLRPGLRPF